MACRIELAVAVGIDEEISHVDFHDGLGRQVESANRTPDGVRKVDVEEVSFCVADGLYVVADGRWRGYDVNFHRLAGLGSHQKGVTVPDGEHAPNHTPTTERDYGFGRQLVHAAYQRRVEQVVGRRLQHRDVPVVRDVEPSAAVLAEPDVEKRDASDFDCRADHLPEFAERSFHQRRFDGGIYHSS